MNGTMPLRAHAAISGDPGESPGLFREIRPHVIRDGPRPAWIPDELLTETMEVCSEAYGRPVSEEEAVEILINVKRLGEAILQAKREMQES